MLNALIGTKKEQSQQFDSSGKRIPVTYISVGPLTVVSVKEKDKDGYSAVQLGLGTRRVKTIKKALVGHLKKAGLGETPPRFLREIRIKEQETNNKEQIQPGMAVNISEILQPGDTIQVTGVSKGKGFAGGVKRHHFKGGPRTHGQSDRERAPGSIGQTTTPGRVYKGKRMAGRMGNQKTTVKNMKVVGIDAEGKLLTVTGLVPGGRNSVLIIQKQEKNVSQAVSKG